MSKPHSLLHTFPSTGLYAITPDCTDTKILFKATEAALAGGCRWLQYRDKISTTSERKMRAHTLAELCQQFQAALIINDDPSLAYQVQAAGVHLGRDDAGIENARQLLGPAAIIGASCYQNFASAQQAARAGANYVAFGAVFPSPTKPEAGQAPLGLFRQAKEVPGMTSCAIGGITLGNAPTLIAAGASLLAVITDLFQNMADFAAIERQALAYQKLFENS